MLLELRAESYTVIDRAEVQFGRGLNLLTGETGAGKSILVDALTLLLGGKASADVIRHGEEKATLACVFEATPGANALLEENGIDADGDTVVLRREISTGGKGRVFINNQPATVGLLRQLAPELALVHAQGETVGAFDHAQQRLLLDRAAAISLDAVREHFDAWYATSSRLRQLQTTEQERLRMADLWRFQANEVSAAAIGVSDEDAQLETERRILGNAEKLYAAAVSANDLLYEAEHAAESTVGAALKHVEELARYDTRFNEAVQQLSSAQAAIEDVAAGLRDFSETIQSSPERLGEIGSRLAELDRLKRKYGPSLADVIARGVEAAARLSEVEDRDSLLADLQVRLAREEEIYRTVAGTLSRQRSTAAKALARRAEREINDLAMRVRFAIEVQPRPDTPHWSPEGWDRIEFRVATNAGEPLKPLTEIASGGEMSRVLLALKVAVEEAQTSVQTPEGRNTTLPRTLIFDEIDVGIGGRAAEAVGQKLRTLAQGQQVLCITHLPQIAAFADHHYVIEKTETKGRTRTRIRAMEAGERVEEIARMLSGAALTETSLRHAEQLLSSSR